jgi:SPP1 family predicted phage head-tail adaptor
MEPGKLRHRISIEAPTLTQNGYGEPVETWAEYAAVWAAREDLAGREAFLAQQVRAEITTRFRLRFLPGVTAHMRVRSDGVLYSIASSADPDGSRRELHLMTSREG